MDREAKSYWNSHYQRHEFARGKAPSPFLLECAPRLPKGQVLDVAMGEGVNAVYLAQLGNKVDAFDISEVACQRAQRLAQDSNVEINVQCTDLDLYLFGIMRYDSIIMTYFRPAVLRYYPEMIKALKQGGALLIESYHNQQLTEAIPRQQGYRNYFFASNEFLPHLKGLRLLHYHEGEIDGKHVVRCLAQKPVERDAAKYNLFDMHTQQQQPKSKQLELAEKLFKKERRE